MLYNTMLDLIGGTPMVELARFAAAWGVPDARLTAKLERQNPCGSAKDRVALNMLRTAMTRGELKPGGLVIEPTSGNTGVGLAAIASVLGLRAIIVMPDSMSEERRRLVAAYGAELVLTPGAQGMRGAIAAAERIKDENPGSIVAGQFENPANPEAHYKTTGPELWMDTQGDLGVFVATIGTGGTISGAGRYLKEQNARIAVVGAEPAGSPVLSGGTAGPHKIQGIGAGFVPKTLDRAVLDRVRTVTDEDAFAAMRSLARTEGLLVGISSGAALCAALEEARMPENAGKRIVALLPDTGERYLSVFN